MEISQHNDDEFAQLCKYRKITNDNILLSSTGSSKLHDNFELEVKKTSIIKARQIIYQYCLVYMMKIF